MAGTLKYYVARLGKVKYPTSTNLETKKVKAVENGKVVDKNIKTKTHKYREVEQNKDGSFDLHEDDVAALKNQGFEPIPWNERGAVEVKSAGEDVKAQNEAAARAAKRDEDKRQKDAAKVRRDNAKAELDAKNKEALELAKKEGDAKGSSKPAKGSKPPADAK